MEAASIFILSSIYRKRAGGIMLIGANQESKDPNVGHVDSLDALLKTAIEAVKIMIVKDRVVQPALN
jgi:uridine phosphorylase